MAQPGATGFRAVAQHCATGIHPAAQRSVTDASLAGAAVRAVARNVCWSPRAGFLTCFVVF